MNIIELFRAKHNKTQIIQLVSFIIACSFFEIILIIIIVSGATCFHNNKSLDRFTIYATAYLLFLITSIQSKHMAIRYTEEIVSEIRKKIIEKIKSIDVLTYEKLDLSNIYNVLTIDTQNVADIVDILWYLFNCLIISLFILLYISYFSQMTLIYVFTFLLLCFVVYEINLIRVISRVKKARINERKLFHYVNDLLFGFKELKINQKKCDHFYDHSVLNSISIIQKMKTRAGYAIADGILLPEMTWLISLFIIIYLSTTFSFLSNDALIKSLQIMIYIPITYILEQLPFVAMANISVKRIHDLEKMIDNIQVKNETKKSTKEAFDPIAVFNEIIFQNLCFHYTDSCGIKQFTVGPINFSMKKGDIVFITGGNGSGKSTLLKMITGLYPPFSGSIQIDSQEIDMSEHRHLFSPIFSDFHLFDRLYGLKSIDSKKINHLIKDMKLQKKVSFVNGGFSTHDLSTGQKKRLALISALLEDKPIYIFDEWAAEQNFEFREYFYKTLLFNIKEKGKTIIAVTHDDQYFHLADKLISLEYGAIK